MICFKNSRSRCYVLLPESEVVKIATMRFLNVHIPDLAHLTEKVRQTKLMKKEKEKYRSEQRSKGKPFTRKEKVAYVTMESSEEEINFETDVDLAELKKGPPYSQVKPVYFRAGNGLLDFLVQQKIKDRDVSLCPRCNVVFDAEIASIFKKERMKKELAHREELLVSSGFGTVRSSKSGMLYIDAIHSEDIRDLLEINTPTFVVEPEVTQEVEGEEEISIRLRNLRWKDLYERNSISCKNGEGKSRVDKNKEVGVDEEYFYEGDDDKIGMISIIPTEYLGEYEGDPDEDYDMEDEEAFSFIRIEDEPGYFLRPTKKQMSHLRLLHITTTLSGIKVNKVLIDGRAAISLLPERMLIKVGKHPDDLVPTNIAMTDFRLSVRLRYPELGFAPTVEFCHNLNISPMCNGSDASNPMADLISAAHCVENRRSVGGGTGTSSSWITRFKTEIKLANVALVGVVEAPEFPDSCPGGPGYLVRLIRVFECVLENAAEDLSSNRPPVLYEKVERQLDVNLQQQELFESQIAEFPLKYEYT
ncbi:hypothetical protein Ahy_B02g061149 [Arachis hypogaea]|uniref:Uncharacterized protein n=1 Tax=Arachis hypogaea TaxID=3818 RepID=A0A445AK50_ARAHY|nr:hypothetical protein Ahy_B02g061149 [Arachis hypogaea]